MSNNLVKAGIYEEKRRRNLEEKILKELNQFWDYDTSQIYYTNMYEPFTLICKNHGAFETTKSFVSNRIKGLRKGRLLLPLCPECIKELSLEENISPKDKNIIRNILKLNNKATPSKQTTEAFIERAKSIHGNKYDYSLTEYKSAHSKIKFKCNRCGGIIEQQACDHLRTQGGCRKCGEKESHEPRKLTEKQFWESVLNYNKEKNWNLDFSKSIFKGLNSLITFKCPIHGDISKKARELYKGHGCQKCGCEANGIKARKSTEQFIKDAKKVHGDYYDYSEVDYKTAFTKIKIIDPEYGPFFMAPNSHLNGQGFGKISNGEKIIRYYFLQHNICFEKEKTFKDLRSDTQTPLRFDFYLPDLNTCIEFQGEQHFKPVSYFGGEESFKKLKENDNKKVEWCSRPENPDLLIINYYDKIIEKLESYIINRTRLIGSTS